MWCGYAHCTETTEKGGHAICPRSHNQQSQDSKAATDSRPLLLTMMIRRGEQTDQGPNRPVWQESGGLWGWKGIVWGWRRWFAGPWTSLCIILLKTEKKNPHQRVEGTPSSTQAINAIGGSGGRRAPWRDPSSLPSRGSADQRGACEEGSLVPTPGPLH